MKKATLIIGIILTLAFPAFVINQLLNCYGLGLVAMKGTDPGLACFGILFCGVLLIAIGSDFFHLTKKER